MRVGGYADGGWSIDLDAITYPGGGKAAPAWRVEPTLTDNTISVGAKVLGYVLVGINWILALSMAVWLVLHWSAPVVKASQPLFLVLVCVGTMISSGAIVPLGTDGFDDGDAAAGRACNSIVVLFSLGFSLSLSALFAKQFRVWIVFKRAAKMRRGAKGAKDDTRAKMFAVVA